MAPNKDSRRVDLGEFVLFPLHAIADRPRESYSRDRPCDATICDATKANPRAVIPYQEPKAKSDTTDFSSTMATTLPMAAMFTRNKFIGWYV